MEISVLHNGRTRKAIVCPQALRKKVIWDTHRLAHAGIAKTTAGVRLEWYWPALAGKNKEDTQDLQDMSSRQA